MIYLDNAATTSVNEKTLEIIRKFSCDEFFNPSSSYRLGLQNAISIDTARKTICKALNIRFNNNVIFTGSATEADNLAIFGTLRKPYGNYVFSEGEHPAVYNSALEMKERGFDVRFIPLQKNGEIDFQKFEEIIDENTKLISVMAVSNETGAINPLSRIGELRDRVCPSALFHSDIVQGFGKIDIDIENTGIDLAVLSGHKIHGPKGIGALVISDRVKLKPIIFGGGQEDNRRSGTENIAYIMALKEIIESFNINQNYEHVAFLRKTFLHEIAGVPYEKNGDGSPYVLSLSLFGIRGETLMHMLEDKGVLISTGSACSSKKMGNRILSSMCQENIIGSIRVSFSEYNTIEEVKTAGRILKETYLELREKLK